MRHIEYMLHVKHDTAESNLDFGLSGGNGNNNSDKWKFNIGGTSNQGYFNLQSKVSGSWDNYFTLSNDTDKTITLGSGATATGTNSMAIGTGVLTSVNNEIKLGKTPQTLNVDTDSTSMRGSLDVQSESTFTQITASGDILPNASDSV
jgi:hypothetical protein